MKAAETTVKDLLEGDKLYVVPRYQRRYAWTRGDWEQLWRAVERQYHNALNDSSAPGHFIGSVVYAQRQAFPTEAPNFDLIDGQQRLTTLVLLMAALRDVAPEGHQVRDRVTALIGNQFEDSEYAYKIRPGDEDREHVYALLSGSETASGGLPLSAYRFFRDKLTALATADAPLDHAALLRCATARLEVVQILTGAGDNAHRIFQTLNSTGKELTAVDLLRNHFFMLLPTQLDVAYATYWRVIELRLREAFAMFIWTDLVSRSGLEGVPNQTERIYAEWQAILDPLAGSEPEVLEVLSDLESRSTVYSSLIRADTGEAAIDAVLGRLKAWGVAVHTPLTYAVLLRWRDRAADTATTVGALSQIESFLVRRMLAGVPTNNLNRVFTTSVGQLATAKDGVDLAVRRILSQPGKYWPSDEALMRDGLTSPFYERQRSTQRQFVLRRIEERVAKPYAPDWNACSFTVEHILPQGLTHWWSEHLRRGGEDEPARAHEDLRHTIGNLTLTCENPALGQMEFPQKAEIYRNDGIRMNDAVAELPRWGRAEILARGDLMLTLASEIWPAPLPAEELDDYALATNVRVVLEAIPAGRWISTSTLTEYLDADRDSLTRALALLKDEPLSDFVLLPEGQLRSDQTGSARETTILANLLAQGLLDSEEAPIVDATLGISVEDLQALRGE